TDVGSTNGLLIGGQRLPVNLPHDLRNGDEIQIGDPNTGNIVTLTYRNPHAPTRTQFTNISDYTMTVPNDAPPPSRNPYTVGSPTRGVHFYGRRDIAASLIDSNDHALWVIGNRRMGKTSLMRFVEEQADARPNTVAFYINLEASENFEDLSSCFFDDLEMAEARLHKLGLSSDQLRGRDAADIVRLLNRSGRSQGVQVLLLWDEAEALIRIGEASNNALRRLHREVQRAESLRLVITATKRLEVLNDLCRSWETSAFLYSFKLRYLGPLSLQEATALVSQRQQGSPVPVTPAFVHSIYNATGGHPYLTQWLCDRLYNEGRLRALADEDLVPSSALASLFQTDYNHLSPSERRILQAFVNVEEVSEETLARQVDGALSPTELRYVLQSLQALCYLRRTDTGYRTGSHLLQNWLRLGYIDETEMPVSDAATIEMSDEQRQHIQRMITINRRNLYTLQERAAQYGLNPPLEVMNEIRQQEESIAALEQQLKELRGE
ncbi:MAG: AAA family ATPase, partial [Chloroflexales bacterium]|nr:AAA family ATPase [Chloroflexales bacterium]